VADHGDDDEHEEHVNHEAWVIPYADMLTLLMALFLVLFAIGRTDTKKAELAAESFKKELSGAQSATVGGAAGGPITGGNGVLDNSGAEVPISVSPGLAPLIVTPPVGSGSGEPTTTTTTVAISTTLSPGDQALADQDAVKAKAKASADSLEAVAAMLQSTADAYGIGQDLTFHLDARGLIVTIVTDQVLFDSGKADLQPSGLQILDLVATALQAIPNDISIEGHTDAHPISNSRYPSNWELSTARATSVLRYLIDAHGMPPQRLSAAGYADTRPIDDNTTTAGASRNRRVEIVVNSTVSLAPVLTRAQLGVN
jgi:chemotaxis protein MotB